MAPNKRQASSAPRSAQTKKPKVSPAEAKLKPVVAAIQKADCLPQDVKAMFKAGMAKSLGVPRGDRAGVQQEVADMIGAALKEIESSYADRESKVEASARTATAEIQAATSTRDAAISACGASEAAVAEKQQVVADALAAVEHALAKVLEAKAAQTSGDADLEVAAAQKERVEAMRRESFAPVREGSMESVEVAKVANSLLQLGKELGLDDSLLASLGAALTKEAGSRGSFDDMVLSQFDTELAQHADALGARIAVGEPAKAERAQGVKDAEAQHEAAEAARRDREGELAALRSHAAGAREDVAAAQLALGQAKATLELATAKLEQARANLVSIRETALPTFRELDSEAAPEAALSEAEATPEAAPSKAEAFVPEAAPSKAEAFSAAEAAIAAAAATSGA